MSSSVREESNTEAGSLVTRIAIGAAAMLVGAGAAAVLLVYALFVPVCVYDKEKAAESQTQKLVNILVSYRLMEGQYPDELDDLTSGSDPLVESPDTLEDPWGRRFVYTRIDGRLMVWSRGRDGRVATEDDVRIDSEKYPPLQDELDAN